MFFYKNIVFFILTVLLCGASYFLGRSHAEVKIVRQKGDEIIKEIEVIKYVDKKKSEIWAEAPADSGRIVELFMQGQLWLLPRLSERRRKSRAGTFKIEGKRFSEYFWMVVAYL